MKVTLTKDLEEFLDAKVESGGYESSSEVIREALRQFRRLDDPAELDSDQLAHLLLPAVTGPHKPLTSQDLDALRRRVRSRRGEA